jgi:hypothetical protein
MRALRMLCRFQLMSTGGFDVDRIAAHLNTFCGGCMWARRLRLFYQCGACSGCGVSDALLPGRERGPKRYGFPIAASLGCLMADTAQRFYEIVQTRLEILGFGVNTDGYDIYN